MKRVYAPFLLFSALLPAGCTTTAARPLSPATQVRFQELEAIPTPRGERYYLLVFGAQSVPKLPRFTHCWATAVRVVDRGPNVPPCLQHDSISWMPATGNVRPWRLRVEAGKNMDLHRSLAVSLAKPERVSVWGPYALSAGAYRKFLMQKAFLESGQVGYQAIDVLGEAGRQGTGYNCIHALTDIDPLFDRSAYPILRFGDAASDAAVRQLAEQGAILNPWQTHDWLLAALGLDRYPLVRCSLRLETDPPR
jgi:hypothetical protein